MIEGIIVNYRIAYTKEVIIKIPEINDRKTAAKLIGKKVVWIDEKGKEWVGKVTGVHGNNGAIRAKFSVPLPPKALAKVVRIEE
jgi:large subunit ribosomal protein L35Ae